MSLRIGRIMGLDVGDSSTGVAISDELFISAQPLFNINMRHGNSIEKLISLINEYGVSKVVIGMPYLMDGTIGEQAQKIEKFGQKLKKRLDKNDFLKDIEIVFWDERLSSIEAERIICGSRLKDRTRREAIDRVSAAVILSSYLEMTVLIQRKLDNQVKI